MFQWLGPACVHAKAERALSSCEGYRSAGTMLGSPLLQCPSHVLMALVAPAKLRSPLGPVGTRRQLGLTAHAVLAEAAGTGDLLFTELMK